MGVIMEETSTSIVDEITDQLRENAIDTLFSQLDDFMSNEKLEAFQFGEVEFTLKVTNSNGKFELLATSRIDNETTRVSRTIVEKQK
jgi:phosphorylcholine metabolism protein LicD